MIPLPVNPVLSQGRCLHPDLAGTLHRLTIDVLIDLGGYGDPPYATG